MAIQNSGATMSEFDARTQANMDRALDEVCSELPNGGDHETRREIAERLIDAARSGKRTLDDLVQRGTEGAVFERPLSAICLTGRAAELRPVIGNGIERTIRSDLLKELDAASQLEGGGELTR